MSDDPNEIDLPYEEQPRTELDLTDAQLSGGVIFIAGVFAEGTEQALPVITFRFAKADGSGFYPPVLLAQTPEQWTDFKARLFQAVNASVRAVKK